MSRFKSEDGVNINIAVKSDNGKAMYNWSNCRYSEGQQPFLQHSIIQLTDPGSDFWPAATVLLSPFMELQNFCLSITQLWYKETCWVPCLTDSMSLTSGISGMYDDRIIWIRMLFFKSRAPYMSKSTVSQIFYTKFNSLMWGFKNMCSLHDTFLWWIWTCCGSLEHLSQRKSQK